MKESKQDYQFIGEIMTKGKKSKKADNKKGNQQIGSAENPFKFAFKNIEDEFDKSQILKFSRIHEMGVDKIWTYSFDDSEKFKFGLANLHGLDYLTFECKKLLFRLEKGDQILFLFENGQIISLTLAEMPNKMRSDDNHVCLENKVHLTIPELEIFKNEKFVKWKLKPLKGREILGGRRPMLSYEIEDFQRIIMGMAQAYEQGVKQYVRTYKPLYTRDNINRSSSTYVERQSIPQDIMDKVWRRDNGKCVRCGSQENIEFDHIIPFSKGGANTYRNLQILCQNCNRSKSNNIG